MHFNIRGSERKEKKQPVMSDQLRLNDPTPLMPALGKQRQKDLCEFPGLQNEFQENQSYKEKPCLKTQKLSIILYLDNIHIYSFQNFTSQCYLLNYFTCIYFSQQGVYINQ